MELFRIKKDIPFMSYGRITTAISLITFLLAIFFLWSKGLHYGVDFTGGTAMEVSYPHAADIDGIRKAIDTTGLKDATVSDNLAIEISFFNGRRISTSWLVPKFCTVTSFKPVVSIALRMPSISAACG